jgi:hypothetical protein
VHSSHILFTIPFQISIEFGSRSLGYKVAIRGQAASRNFNKDVPFAPLNGKQEYFVTVTPGVAPPKAFEMQLQYVSRESSSAAAEPVDVAIVSSQSPSSPQSDSDWSLGSILGWFGSEEKTLSAAPSHFVNLRRQSVTAASLQAKFPPKREALSSGPKYGVVFRLASVGSEPIRQLQVEALCQPTTDGAHTQFDASIVRSPIPEEETVPWKVCSIMVVYVN